MNTGKLFEKLGMTKVIHLPSGAMMVKIRRWHPFNWILFVLLLGMSPIICFFSNLSIVDILTECWNILRGKAM